MNAQAVLVLALPLAWLLDLAFGKPRNALHPVAWIGRVLAPAGRLAGTPRGPHRIRRRLSVQSPDAQAALAAALCRRRA